MATRKISVEIVGSADNLKRAFGQAADSGRSFGSSLGRVAKMGLLAAGAAGIGGLALVLKAGIPEFMEAAKVSAQTAATIKSTGGAANVTAKSIEALSASMMQKTGIDDELIQTGANLLLTFKNVRNEVGKGNDVFNQATKAALNLSTAGFGSVESASKMMGKALNDPIKGMTALGRAGVTFSEEQKKAIKALVQTGDLLGAQKIILKEVESQVGGSAEAYGKTLPGQLKILKESFNNLAGSLVGGLVPSFSKAVSAASDFVAKLSAAKGFKAKLNIVWEGIQEAGRTITDKLGDAIKAVDWTAVWAKASGIAEGLSDRFKSINWTAVGTTIGDGIASAVTLAMKGGGKIVNAAADAARSINWTALGKAMGPGLAAAMVTAFVTLLDPMFWIKNWDLALAVALVVFGRGIGKLVAPIGKLISGALGTAWSDGIVAVAVVIERLSPRLAAAVMFGLLKLPGLVGGLFGRLGGIVGAGFARLGALAQFTVKILGIMAALNAIGDFAGDAKEKAKEVGWAIVQGILGGLGSLYGMLKAKIGSIIGSVLGSIDIPGRSPPAHAAAEAIGKPLAEGVIQGWILGSAALPDKMKESLQKAIEAARAVIETARGTLSTAWSALSSDALAAFDAISGQIKTKSEKLLAAMQLKRQVQGIKDAIAEARKALTGARMALTQGEDESDVDFAARRAAANEATKAAQKQLDDALFAQREFALQQRAAQERLDEDARRDRQRSRLVSSLAELGASLAKEGATAAGATKAVLKLLARFDVNFRDVGAAMGQAWIQGLKETLEAAARGAGALAGTIQKQAAKINVPKLAHGGIVTRPTLAMIGEAGPEAVVPLGRGGGIGGGTTNNYFSFPHYIGDKRDLEAAMVTVLNRYGRRGGALTVGIA